MATLSRRTALALTGASLTAALAASAAVPASSELDSLIDAHRKAWARFEAAIDAEQEFDRKDTERRELFVPLSLGFTQSLHASRDLSQTAEGLRKEIAGRYRGEMQRSINMLSKASPEIGKQATAALRKAQADDLRTMRRVIREEQERREAIGYAACIREWQGACDAENDALEAVLLHRCRSPEELATKAAYASKVLAHCMWQEWQTDALLASMLPEGRA